MKKKNEFLYFALRNSKLRVGLSIVLFFLALSFVGPLLTEYTVDGYVGPASQPPSSKYWFGTTTFGQDVYTQFAHGLGATFLVGLVGGGLGTLIGVVVGFTAGYRGGMVDELLNMLTNIVLVLPTLALLLIISAYLEVRGVFWKAFSSASRPGHGRQGLSEPRRFRCVPGSSSIWRD